MEKYENLELESVPKKKRIAISPARSKSIYFFSERNSEQCSQHTGKVGYSLVYPKCLESKNSAKKDYFGKTKIGLGNNLVFVLG